MSTLEAIQFDAANGQLRVLDQLLLPHRTEYITVCSAEDGARVIRNMNVRGAPALAITAALSLATELFHIPPESFYTAQYMLGYIQKQWQNVLNPARPTAVNLAAAGEYLIASCIAFLRNQQSENINIEAKDMAKHYCDTAYAFFKQDVETNRQLADHGARWILEYVHASPSHPLLNTNAKSLVENDNDGSVLRILTHCNTGSLVRICTIFCLDMLLRQPPDMELL